MNDIDVENDSEGLDLDTVFPEAPRPPSPEPTVSTYTREAPRNFDSHSAETRRVERDEDGRGRDWSEISIRLVGSHPLWGHYLWNAARAFATYLDHHILLYKGKNVLELGAGGGLPGLVTVLNGSRRTVLTDYPDQALLDNLEYNIKQNIPAHLSANVSVLGYIWGTPVDRLLETAPGGKYDLIILSDLVFNHSQHEVLLRTCELALRGTDKGPSVQTDSDETIPPTVLVFYTHHRPHLASRDLEFFTKAENRGWTCREIVTNRFQPMFPDDPGDEEVRATVHGWSLTR